MHRSFAEKLSKFAEVLVKVGVNVQPGQRLLIGHPIFTLQGVSLDLYPLIRQVARHAYQAGASLVDVLWDDPHLQAFRLELAPRSTLNEFSKWRADSHEQAIRQGDAILMLGAYDPDLLSGFKPEAIQTIVETTAAHMQAGKELRAKVRNNACISAAPIPGWAIKVFPALEPAEAMKRFWETTFAINRIDDPDPIQSWIEHIAGLDRRCDQLNARGYTRMHLTAPGTDLWVGFPQRHFWIACHAARPDGVKSVFSIPTEEVYTITHKYQTEGVATFTKPVSPGGITIEGLRVRFESGRVVEASAKTGEQYIPSLLDADEGARYLGELALVPHSSPLSQTGLIFSNVLLDENAACHIAFGSGIKSCLEDGEKLSAEDLRDLGGNTSGIHVDCMIGSGEMDVDGLRQDGTCEPVMRAGEFVI